MERPKIPQKYLDLADESYHGKPSVYRSAYALKLALRDDATFKKQYEAYAKTQKRKIPALSRWFREQWIQVEPYIKTGEKIECGAATKTKGKACRPLKRINQKTPITIDEVLEHVSTKRLLREIKKKQKNPDHIIRWSSMTKQAKKN